jgi:fructan beta-fructosidase
MEHPMESKSRYKPLYHFAPSAGWMNDPNGLIYYEGSYHMFFQKDSCESVFHNMSWGHAISKDLVHWEELENALLPDERGVIFSGCAILDKKNVAGFGENTMLAFYTSTLPRQQQCMAYSLDLGMSFQKYALNPVIKNDFTNPMPDNFRDPKVVWYQACEIWLMVIGAHDHIDLWSSEDLTNWKRESQFFGNPEMSSGIYECPDLVQLSLQGVKEAYKWVLFISMTQGSVNGGCTTIYYVGDIVVDSFGVIRFREDDDTIRFLDYGKDNYASVTWSNISTRTILIGWMSNWEYAFNLPTYHRKGVMTLPKEITLVEYSGELKIKAKPVIEIETYMNVLVTKTQSINEINDYYVGSRLMCSKISLTIELLESTEVGIELFNALGEKVRIGYNKRDERLYVDRRESESIFIHDRMNEVDITSRIGKRDKIVFEIYIDRTSVEVLFELGEYFMTELVFPVEPYKTIKVYGDDKIKVVDFILWTNEEAESVNC